VEVSLPSLYSLGFALLLALLLPAVPLEAADVQEACRFDFNRYCGHYDPYSTSGKACMRSIGRSHRLNRDCYRALEEGGYVTQADREAYKHHH
jgi:hypothetical protein